MPTLNCRMASRAIGQSANSLVSLLLSTTTVLLLLLLLSPVPANAASPTFNEMNGIDNYTFEFTSDGTYAGFQPNMFAGIAAAFHEYNTAPLPANVKAKPYYTLQLINQTEDSAVNVVGRNDSTFGTAAVRGRMVHYLSNASALAAYRATNPTHTMDDYLLSLGADPSNQRDMTARAAMAGVPLGYAGGGPLTSYSIIAATFEKNYTTFGVTSTNVAYQTDTRFIKMRGNTAADFPVVMNLGFHRADLRCTSFLLLHLPIGDFINVLSKTLFDANGYTYDIVSRDDSLLYDTTQIYLALAKKPSCIMFVDIAEIIEGYIPVLQSLTTHDLSSVPFVGFGYNYKPEFKNPSSFKNLYMAQIMPHPDDTTSKFSVRGKAALNAYFAAVPDELYGNASESNCSVVNASVTSTLPIAVGGVCRILDYMKPSPFLEYQMMEGYAIGRLILDAAAATPGIVNMTTIRETVYRQRMFLFDDFDLGPYTDKCSAGGVFPCFCTSGVRSMFTARVNGTTGRSYAVKDRTELGEKNIATSTFPYTECQTGFEQGRRSINVVLLDLDASAAAVEGSSTQFPGYEAFSTTLSKVLSNFSISDFYASGSIYVVRRTLTLAEYQSSSTVEGIVATLANRYQPFVIATSFAANRSLANASVAASRAAFIEMRGAGLRETPNNHPTYTNEMAVDASLPELIHGAASIAAQQAKAVLIVADTSAQGELARKSLHTFGKAESGVVVSGDGSGLSSVASHVGGGGVVLVASLTTSTVQGVLEAVTGLSGSPSGSVFIGAPEAGVYLASVQAAAAKGGANVSVSVGFASGMKAWWMSTTPLGQRVAAVQYDDGMGGGSSAQTFLSNPIHAKAAYFAWSVYAAAARAITVAAALGGGAPTFPETLNSAGSIDVSGVQLGPYSNTSCVSAAQLALPDRTCQCQNGLSEVYVHDLASMLSGTASSSPSQRFSGCTLAYVPLPTVADDNTNLLIGVVAGVVGGVLLLVGGVIVVYFCCFAGRSSKCAPKDEGMPFTMVFTDIQASTMLWARAPSAMAPAVDMHHEVLRDVLGRHRGYEVKTIGDSFMIAFQQAADAVRFSAAAQHALFSASWAPGIDETYRDITLEKLEEHQRVVPKEDMYEAFDNGIEGGSSPSVSKCRSPNNLADLNDMLSNNVPTKGDDDTERLLSVYFQNAQNQLLTNPDAYRRNWCGVRVRIGVHTGMGSIKKDPVSGGYDYYGTVVNTAARVEGVGHGGQVLVTDSTYDVIRDSPVLSECGCVAVDLGDQPLRGLDAPVRLYQLTLAEFPDRAFPPLRLDVENDAAEGEASMSDDDDSVGSVMSARSRASQMSKQSVIVYSRLEDYYNPDNYARRVATNKYGGGADASDADLKTSNLSTFKSHAPTTTNGGGNVTAFQDAYLMVTTLLSTMNAAKAHEILAALSKTWRVRLLKERALLNMCKKRAVRNRTLRGPYPTTLPREAHNKFHAVQLLEKVHPVMEINRRKLFKSNGIGGDISVTVGATASRRNTLQTGFNESSHATTPTNISQELGMSSKEATQDDSVGGFHLA